MSTLNDQAKANARWIKHGPDLLNASEWLVLMLRSLLDGDRDLRNETDSEDIHTILTRATATIKKAGGEL